MNQTLEALPDFMLCPHDGANGILLRRQPDGNTVKCAMCKRVLRIAELRNKAEYVTKRRSISENVRKGYNPYAAISVKEQNEIDRRLNGEKGIDPVTGQVVRSGGTRIRLAKNGVDINTPDLHGRRFSNYIKDGSWKKHFKEMNYARTTGRSYEADADVENV